MKSEGTLLGNDGSVGSHNDGPVELCLEVLHNLFTCLLESWEGAEWDFHVQAFAF